MSEFAGIPVLIFRGVKGLKFDGIEKYTAKKIARNLETAQLDEEYIPAGSSIKYYPLAVDRAKGSLIWDRDGNRYIDFLASAAVYNIGHCHPLIVEAVKKQAETCINYSTGYLFQENPARLAKVLCEITPGIFRKKAAFGFSGSDANDSAIMAARAYTGRKNILAFKESYHGTTYGALAVTGIIDENIRKRVSTAGGTAFLDFPDPDCNPWGIDGNTDPRGLSKRAIEAARDKIDELGGDVAAIIIEPIQGDCGVIIPPVPFMKDLEKLCREKGIILIDEEVQSGMGRTGKMWAIELFDVVPDILVTGKSLGGGLPLSAVIGREEVMDSVPSPLFCMSHVGHALCTGAALKAIGIVRDENLTEEATRKGDYLADAFRSMAGSFGFIGSIRHRGLLFGVDIVDEASGEPDRETALKICWRAWEKGLIMITFGKSGNVLRIAPPLNIEKELMDEALDIIKDSVADVAAGKVPDEVIRYLSGW